MKTEFNPHYQTIVVLYSCVDCGLKDVPLKVRARNETEGIVAWMEATTITLAQNHSKLSPGCNARKLTEVKIPLTNADRVGGVAIQ